ncbi:unnamed protein product [Didymodactylos carnosus]|uniref:Uncharacterized protein n=1 Tax=Didymodactylos carnosus TaxID=1234261 RepID=A0A815GXZ4_9BILA|nr:unnamed protein product [Didymodactylos carnosus]CAF1344881.1 unnamed protein product [Didymodactylos carnosus]CAF3848658.1 unnamed protein product [Didymodactylos carnosus]CAF4209599.1 unnamed protein product [Didymodactylos carnosus]
MSEVNPHTTWERKIKQTDHRVKLMNEIVRYIRLVKMYTWEKPFQFKVEKDFLLLKEQNEQDIPLEYRITNADQTPHVQLDNIYAKWNDLESLHYGMWTLVGDNGITLSGGQKARLSLARALYRNYDIYLLDDPLSAVDPKTGKFIYQKCIRGFLKHKVCILVTHQIQYLKNATKILCMEKGHITDEGTYHELLDKSESFCHLIHEIQHQKSESISETNDKNKLEQLDSICGYQDGRIINRFAKDTAIIDETLPTNLFDYMDCLFITIGTFILINIINPWTLIPTILGFIGLLYIRQTYISSAQDCQRLESLSRSPVYSHLSAMLDGVITARAFRATEICIKDFERYLDNHTKAIYLLRTVDRWGGIRFDWLSAGFLTFLVFSSLLMHKSLPSANVTVAIVHALTLIGFLQWFIRLGTELLLQMTAVERINEYCHLPVEESKHNEPPKPHWPADGQIKFDNLSFRYSIHSSWILNKIDLVIQPKEKIGIVGRTGAGKSSIIQALFRMADLEGKILIDGIDTKSISLNSLRNRISIIPQDPVLFDDSIRNNVDPFGEYSEIEIWNALEEVQLKPMIIRLPYGLSHQISEGGANFSVGQRQLMCLARALLRKNKILVIDEATANVDMA